MHSCRQGGERADGEGREQTGRGESRRGGERADEEGREQMRKRNSTGEVWNFCINIRCPYEYACCGMAVLEQVCTTTLY